MNLLLILPQTLLRSIGGLLSSPKLCDSEQSEGWLGGMIEDQRRKVKK